MPKNTSSSSSGLSQHLNTKRENKNTQVKKMHQQKKTTQPEMKKGLMYKPKIKKPSKKMLAPSVKMEKARKTSLKKTLKNTLSEKSKRMAKDSPAFESKRGAGNVGRCANGMDFNQCNQTMSRTLNGREDMKSQVLDSLSVSENNM